VGGNQQQEKEETVSDHEFDPFKLSSGLPLVGATVTVESLTFGIDNEYDAEACVAIIVFQPDEGESQRQLYSVGKTFEAGGTGETLVHKSGKKVNLNDNSNYGRLVQSFTTMEGAAEAMAEVRNREVEPVFDGAWIEGMRFVLGELKFKGYAGKGKDPSEAPDKTLIVFSEYLGTGDEAPKKATKATSKLAPKGGAAKAAPKAAAADEDEEYGIDDEDVRKAVIKLATKHAGDFDTYSDKATDIDGVMENAGWRKAVMSTKPGSIWAAFGQE